MFGPASKLPLRKYSQRSTTGVAVVTGVAVSWVGNGDGDGVAVAGTALVGVAVGMTGGVFVGVGDGGFAMWARMNALGST